MIDYIKNGVTTGGAAPFIAPEPQGANIYSQYMDALYKERQDAMNKNNELLKDIDLSKVDPRDRSAVQGLYDQWKQMALRPPQTSNRRDIMAWRQQVMQGATDVINSIGEVKAARQSLATIFDQNKDKLSTKGLQQFNDVYGKPVVDPETGQINAYNANQFEHEPERAYSASDRLTDLLKGNTSKDVQVGLYKRKDGKYVQKHADIVNGNKYVTDALNEYDNNPQFARVFDNQFAKYKADNPGTALTARDFVQQAAQGQLPQQTDWDKGRLQGVKTTPGFNYYNLNEKEPNDWKMTVNNGRSFADKKAEVLANYQNLMSNLHSAVGSGDPAALSNAAQQWSPFLLGKSLDGDGKVSRAQIVKTPDGRTVLRATKTNELTGMAKDVDFNLNDPATWQKLHTDYNNQFRDQNFGLQVPANQLDEYTHGLNDQQSDNTPVPLSLVPDQTTGAQPIAGTPNPNPGVGNPSTPLTQFGEPMQQPVQPQSKLGKLKQKLNNGLFNFGNQATN